MKEKIKQSNWLTTARYEYTAVQKNIMYKMLGFVQELFFSKDPLPEVLTIRLSVAELSEHNNNTRIIAQIKELMKKPIDYQFRSDNKEYQAVTTLISHAQHEIGSSFVEIQIPKKSIILLTDLMPGYTEYKRKIALELKSIYSKRMYEMISRWDDKKGFVIEVENLKKMLSVDEKYEKYSAFKKYVLEAARLELKAKADLYYEYEEIKKGRKYDRINFKVIKQKGEAEPPKQLSFLEGDEKSQRCLLRLRELGITRHDILKEIISHKQKEFWAWYKTNASSITDGKYDNPAGVLLKHLEIVG